MTFYESATMLTEFLMIAMLLHVLRNSVFTKRQKIWFSATFISIMLCSMAEFAVYCGMYTSSWAIPMTVITAIRFSCSPLIGVFFTEALGLYRRFKAALVLFLLHAVFELAAAPFGLVFSFGSDGFVRGPLFIVYGACYFLALVCLVVDLAVVGRRFRHSDILTIAMIVVVLLAGIVPMTFMDIHIAYLAVSMSATLCYIYYNDLVQEDIECDLVTNQERMSSMQEHTISGLASLIENRDTETGGHVARTCLYVKQIAEEARDDGVYTDEIDDHFISLMCTLAPMHDVGKIVVPDQILKKPGRLTPEEFDIMKTHASEGGKVVRQILNGIADEEYIQMASDIAQYHHEKWDGTGYPNGLSGTDIPLCARIMALADVFDALISERCYKHAMPVKDALDIIKKASGSHFDPNLARVFLNHSDKYMRENRQQSV